MTPQDFIAKWGPGGPAFDLNERQGAQPHFIDLCQLLGVPTPGSSGDYIFEQDALVLGEARGYADVFMRNHFAWENKAPGKNLDTALKQLLTYSLALSNPPLLVVCDRLTVRIHTQFNGHPSEVHTVRMDDMADPAKQALLRRLWTHPESFRPKKTSRDITEAAAKSFATLADGLRRRKMGSDPNFAEQNRGSDPILVSTHLVQDEIAHFLTQCLFCFFAEDVGLLPSRMFEGLVNNKHLTSDKLTQGLTNLFTTMCDGGLYGNDDIPWFNGGLFKKVKVPRLSILEVTELRNAAALNWSAIDVSIFGTLFERGLDPAKRSQLGAHYTDPATILRIIDPVLTRPLLQKWELIAEDIRGLMAKSKQRKRAAYSAGGRHFKASLGDALFQKAERLFHEWLTHLNAFRVLDPACGSGNFLFMGLKALKDIEHRSHLDAAMCGLDREADLVTGPHNVLGIELNEYAAELARVTVWIGELQWRMAHGYEFKTNPVLEPLEHIECRDALLSWSSANSTAAELGSDHGDLGFCHFAKRNSCSDPISAAISEAARNEPGARAAQMPGPHTLRFLKSAPTSAPPTPLNGVGSHESLAEMGSDPNFAQQNLGSDPISAGSTNPANTSHVTEAPWPKANVVIGNPPFLGGSKKRRELGDDYFAALDSVFAGRVPGGADLVCYWFDKARVAIEGNGLSGAGLVSTNSIRGGSNRKVLDAICQSTRIFEAWSDEGWVNDGAAVRVSLICFGHALGTCLNGKKIGEIHSDLTGTEFGDDVVDLSKATRQAKNAGAIFEGLRKDGPLDISGQLAREWLRLPNPHGKPNALVLFPLINGIDVTRRRRDGWVIDTGESLTEQEAAFFEAPFTHILQNVKPIRLQNNDRIRRTYWWRFGRNGEQLRAALKPVTRYINTPRVAKHRLFVWQSVPSIPDTATVAISRADDTTFGILHSRFHELWSLRMCTWLGVGNDPRYTPTTCFETFPFPEGLTPADTAHQRTEALPGGAVIPAQLESDPRFPDASENNEQNSRLALMEQTQAAIKNRVKNSAKTKAVEAGLARMSGAILKSEAYEPPASEPTLPGSTRNVPASTAPTPDKATRQDAMAIAQAAKRLNDLRENWLNPPEWTHKVPEVIPLGMTTSPYPDRTEPKPGISEQDLKALQKRTLTNLYNAKPAWLTMAHQQLDAAVAAAYGWANYTADMPDDDILKRLLALNLARSAAISGAAGVQTP